MICDHDNKYILLAVRLHVPSLTFFSLSLPAACADLDEAVVTPGDIVMGQGEERQTTCNALSSLQTQTVWFKVTYTQYSSYTNSSNILSLKYHQNELT